MDSFKPRELTEAVMSRFYKNHNPNKKLENPTFIAGIMKLSDGEIRSAFKKRYHATPGNRASSDDKRLLSSPPPQGLLLNTSSTNHDDGTIVAQKIYWAAATAPLRSQKAQTHPTGVPCEP